MDLPNMHARDTHHEMFVIWALIDLSYLAYRAHYSLRGMEFEDYPTGVIFGFFEQLRTICQDPAVNSNKIAIFTDSKKSYRKKQFPEYKRKRKDNRSEEEKEQLNIVFDQIKILKRVILPDMGIPVYSQSGLEADDLMAYVCKKIPGAPPGYLMHKASMITSDGDLYQCITPESYWYDPGRGTFHNPITFEKKYGVHPEEWASVKAMAGCKTDEVPGVPGVGEKTAIKYLLGALPAHHKTFQAIESEEGKRIIKRNWDLVKLPHAKTKPFQLKAPEYNPDAFFAHCETYGITTYLQKNRMNQWLSFFNGTKRRTRKRRKQHG